MSDGTLCWKGWPLTRGTEEIRGTKIRVIWGKVTRTEIVAWCELSSGKTFHPSLLARLLESCCIQATYRCEENGATGRDGDESEVGDRLSGIVQDADQSRYTHLGWCLGCFSRRGINPSKGFLWVLKFKSKS